MHDHVTIVRPERGPHDPRRTVSAIPADLLDQVRGRLQLLASFFFFAFGFDLVIVLGAWAFLFVTGTTPPPAAGGGPSIPWINVGGVLLSGAMWWAAHGRRVSASRLYPLGAAYEIAICFAISFMTYSEY